MTNKDGFYTYIAMFELFSVEKNTLKAAQAVPKELEKQKIPAGKPIGIKRVGRDKSIKYFPLVA